jgi:type IV pilus assembly protein PilA
MMNKKGFTLIELLVVIGIIVILAAIVLVAVNPGRQLATARNAQRSSDVNTILNAVNQYMVDHNGQVPGTLSACSAGFSDIGTGGVNLATALVATYVAQMPMDPGSSSNPAGTAADTEYDVCAAADPVRVTVYAPHAELGQTIQVSR